MCVCVCVCVQASQGVETNCEIDKHKGTLFLDVKVMNLERLKVSLRQYINDIFIAALSTHIFMYYRVYFYK